MWYAYPGQAAGSDVLAGFSGPARTARRLDDGNTELSQATYKDLGQVASRADPVDQNRASWNRVTIWLQGLERLRCAA